MRDGDFRQTLTLWHTQGFFCRAVGLSNTVAVIMAQNLEMIRWLHVFIKTPFPGIA